jgi:stigma-specific protein Stig1
MSLASGVVGWTIALALFGVACGTEVVVRPSHEEPCVCPNGDDCVDGKCPGGICGPGLTQCGKACIDTAQNPQHCGGCGKACNPGDLCVGGVCATGCPPGLEDCFGVCVDVSTDPQNCGGCGNPCPPGWLCAGGGCTSECPLTLCGDQCVDIFTDPNHCGACFSPCDPGAECHDAVCSCTDPNGICGLCNVTDLGSAVPQMLTGAAVQNQLAPSCAPEGSNEALFLFTAPASATYVFDTAGSSFDTVLYLLSGCMEIACNDDSMDVTSHLELALMAGQQIVIAVDGFGGDGGLYVLSVTQEGGPSCPETNIGSVVPQTLTGSTTGAADLIATSCIGAGAPERTYGFTAPMTATYAFDTFGSSYDTVLEIRNGGCGGQPIGCNDDSGGLQSQVIANLTSGQAVTIVVDGFGASFGSYVLHVAAQ